MFYSLNEAREMCENWRIDYNEERPHKALNYLSPLNYARMMNRDQRYPQAANGNPLQIEESRLVDNAKHNQSNSIFLNWPKKRYAYRSNKVTDQKSAAAYVKDKGGSGAEYVGKTGIVNNAYINEGDKRTGYYLNANGSATKAADRKLSVTIPDVANTKPDIDVANSVNANF